MSKAKYEDDTGESGWVSAEDAKPVGETKEEREARELRGEAVKTPAEAKAISAEEKVAAEKEELEGKETVRGKIARMVGQLRSGQLFGAARKAAWGELEELVGWLKGDETVGEVLKERRAAEEKLEKGEKKEAAKEEKAGKW
jgi:hypothetical protein